MKFYKFWALLACTGLIISCFLPWTYYPDLNKVFTGFFSEKNIYGKPAKVFIFFAVIYLICVFIDRVWAKRFNVLFAALNLAYLIKTWILFTGCYSGICPEKRYGIYLLLVSCLLMMVTALLPDYKLKEDSPSESSLE